MSKKKILIVGGTGFLGFHIALKALKKKWNVSSISTQKPKKHRYLKNVKYYLCDVTNKKKLEKILKEKFDFIINFSGYVDHSKKNKTFLSHFIGCKNLVDIILKKKTIPKMFIQIGSCIENGKIKSPQIENLPRSTEIKSTYGQAKLDATKFLLKEYSKNNFPFIVLRPYLIYGPNQDPNRFIPFIIKKCLQDKKFPISKCLQFRDFLYIDDFTKLIFIIFKKKKGFGNIFNIGYGKPIQLKKIVSVVQKKIKKGIPEFGKIKMRPDEILTLYPNTNKIKKFYNWSANVNFLKGISRTIKYFNLKNNESIN
ncbi:NAD(P)-dependent oxidoreductase [Candidatus Pelagibacter sp.]|nr:NAD(P)-dependent oxidoreductase [Candidatus Pelagibacter sp.]